MDTLVLLLPERRRFGDARLAAPAANRLARADWLADGAAGELAQLQRHFDMQPRGWPMAAIQRQADCGDAGSDAWLRADPVHVRPDLGGARLLAWGNLGLSGAEAEALLEPLCSLFGDAGLPISAGAGERWYLQVAPDAPLPEFSSPEAGLGDDLIRHLPAGPHARRWRTLLSEAQVLLHNHPVNARRQAAGQLPANSLWFWGGGMLPLAVRCDVRAVLSGDHELRALARVAGLGEGDPGTGGMLWDLRRQRDWSCVEAECLLALPRQFARFSRVELDFADGARCRLEPGQRWRVWRRPRWRLQA